MITSRLVSRPLVLGLQRERSEASPAGEWAQRERSELEMGWKGGGLRMAFTFPREASHPASAASHQPLTSGGDARRVASGVRTRGLWTRGKQGGDLVREAREGIELTFISPDTCRAGNVQLPRWNL